MEATYYALNPWWDGRETDWGIPRTEYLSKLAAALERKQIEMVTGGRRVGKTTLVKQLVAQCLAQGVAPRDILYLALDHPRLTGAPLTELVRFFRSLHGHDRTRKLWFAESEREADFVLGATQPEVVEVKYENTFDGEDRRLAGVRLFLRRYPACKRVTVVTRDASSELVWGHTRVAAIPLWRYLLEQHLDPV